MLSKLSEELRSPLNVAVSLLLALSIVLGHSITRSGLLPWGQEPAAIVASLLSFVAIWALLAIGIALLFSCFDSLSNKEASSSSLRPALCVIVLLVCWAPYVICAWPGNTHGDYLYQLMQFLGSMEVTNHHPVIMTYLFGLLYSLGSAIGGPNLGVAFATLVQIISSAAIFTYSLIVFARWGLRFKLQVALLLFYSLNPLIPTFLVFDNKDILSSVLMCWFLLLVCDTLFSWKAQQNPPTVKRWVLVAFVGLLCSLSRSNCVFAIIPTLLVLALITNRSARRYAIASAAAIICVFLLWTKAVIPALGIAPGPIVEAMSVPLQQTAAYIKYEADDITPEQYERIQAVTDLDDIGLLGKEYTSTNSDFVKSSFHFDSGADLVSYLKTWAEQGLKHPNLYLTVFLKGNYGYWYPFMSFSQIKWGNTFDADPESYLKSLAAIDFYDISGPSEELWELSSSFPQLHKAMQSFIKALGDSPLLGILFQPAFYGWLVLIIGGWAIKRKKQGGILAFVALGILFVTCCFSPDYSNMRYMISIVEAIPILMAASFTS